MIRYALICDKAHEFESWFPSSAGFEQQAKRGLREAGGDLAAALRRLVAA